MSNRNYTEALKSSLAAELELDNEIILGFTLLLKRHRNGYLAYAENDRRHLLSFGIKVEFVKPVPLKEGGTQ